MEIFNKKNMEDTMARPYFVEQAGQVPVHSPEVPDPAIYAVPDVTSLTVYCRAKPGIIAKYLEHTPFESVSDDFIVYVCDMTKGQFEQGGFMDTGIVIPVRFNGILGGHVLFEYESSEHGICCGRELWGYPKKYAEASIKKEGDKIIASCIKRGVELMHLELDTSKPTQSELPDLKLKPHLQLWSMPAPDRRGVFAQRVLSRDTSADFEAKEFISGAGAAALKACMRNPLDEFNPVEVYGATYDVGDFYSTEENGWAKVLAEIVKPTLIE